MITATLPSTSSVVPPFTRQVVPSSGGITAFSGAIERRTLPVSRLAWRDQADKELEILLRLENGWDGYGGQPVSFQNATFAMQILENVASPETRKPQFIPGTRGDLQMEWHTETLDLEIHVRAPNDVDVWFRDEATGRAGQEFHVTNDFRRLLSPIDKAR